MTFFLSLRAVALAVLAALFSFSWPVAAQDRDVSKLVDPFIGTGDHGHTFPGPTTPFGMVQLSPDTRTEGWDACGGYHFSDAVILGFSHTHLSGTGIGDYGDFLFMPFTGETTIAPGASESYRSHFDHSSELARPGYYRVILTDPNVQAELTATTRAGFHRYTFPATDSAGFIIDMVHSLQNRRVLQAELKVLNDHEIEGWRHMQGWAQNRWIYFHATFSKPFHAELFSDGKMQIDAQNLTGQKLKARLKFATTNNEQVLVKVGISPVDNAGASNNLAMEIPAWDFEGVVKDAAVAWEKQLEHISIRGGSDEAQKIFYTALYHSSICPNIFSDADGRYRGMDQQVHTNTTTPMYTVFSLWDTFRAQHPLYTIIDPDLDQTWIRTLLRDYDEGGILPMWPLAANYTGCMIGYHAVSVIVDAYNKGLRDYDTKKAMDAVLFSSVYDENKPIPYNSKDVKNGLMPKGKLYTATKGFIPADLDSGSVSKGLEYAYNDWLIALMAKDQGRKNVAAEYFKRARNYQSYFDAQTGFMRPKMSDGSWLAPFNPTFSNNGHREYVEGNAWQWSWFAPQDVPGLIRLYGGKEPFAKKLNELFTTDATFEAGQKPADVTGLIGQYAHGNEPSHHIIYLFNFADQPWRTADLLLQVMHDFYKAAPAGLIGNEDCGQMSAWFILSSMGIYQVTPGDPKFSIGRPLFDEVRIPLKNGQTFVVTMKNGSPENKYVQKVTLAGKKLKTPFITYDAIMAGKTLVFEMGTNKTVFWK